MNHANAKRVRIAGPSPAPATVSRPAAPPTHQEIARAAFGYWQSQGGDAKQNWLRCERELHDRRLVLG
jgi:hypothetical protein